MTRTPRLQASALAVLAALVLLASGCDIFPGKVERADVIGKWTSDASGTLNFAEDGSFNANGLKNEVFDSYDKPGEARSGSGEWSLLDSDGCILLAFDELSGSKSKGRSLYRMSCTGTGASARLYFVIGDPDDHNFYYFTKDS